MNVLRKFMEKEIQELKPVLFRTYNLIADYQEERTVKKEKKVRRMIRETSQLLKPFIPHIPDYKQRFLLALLAIDEIELSVGEEIFLLDEAVGEMHIRLRRERSVDELNQPWTDDLLNLLNERRNLGLEELEEEMMSATGVLTGLGIQTGKVTGMVQVIEDPEDFPALERGVILVTRMTNPDLFAYFGRVLGIVTEEGGRVCHAAVLAREFAIPCVVGCKGALAKLRDGQLVEMDSESGEVRVLEG